MLGPVVKWIGSALAVAVLTYSGVGNEAISLAYNALNSVINAFFPVLAPYFNVVSGVVVPYVAAAAQWFPNTVNLVILCIGFTLTFWSAKMGFNGVRWAINFARGSG